VDEDGVLSTRGGTVRRCSWWHLAVAPGNGTSGKEKPGGSRTWARGSTKGQHR
jgi:hypothetical protein